MHTPEERLIDILRDSGTDFVSSLPCEKIKSLLVMIGGSFRHVPLSREEEGVGISAGAALAGRRPAMFVQSSGVGNMINALLSLTHFYRLPLAVFISHRGIYKEQIAAQLPMGRRLPGLLRAAGIPSTVLRTPDDFRAVERHLPSVYRRGTIHAFLMSPSIWEGSAAAGKEGGEEPVLYGQPASLPVEEGWGRAGARMRARLTRFEMLRAVRPFLEGKAVICNLGIPSKELYALGHRPSYFYMLGSMGMATPIALGVALSSGRQVVVIDGDGSLLMNPGTLATAAHLKPGNLTILAIDNAAYGSTGNQPTLTGSCVDLETVARGFGIGNTVKVSGARELARALKGAPGELTFIHALARAGNEKLPPIPLDPLENKREVQEFLAP